MAAAAWKQRTPRDINTPVPAFGRAGADLTRPIDSPYFFLMAGTLVRVEGVRPSAGNTFFLLFGAVTGRAMPARASTFGGR